MTSVLNFIWGANGTGNVIQSLNMVSSVFPARDSTYSTVRAWAGLNHNWDLDGSSPGVGLWNSVGHNVGRTFGGKQVIIQGSYSDTRVYATKKEDRENMEYLAMSDGSNNGVCIAALGITTPGGANLMWSGDVGRACGAPWYYSQSWIGTPSFHPTCVFLDRNRDESPYQGMSMHLTDFFATDARVFEYANDTRTMCTSPRFTMLSWYAVTDAVEIYWPLLEYNGDLTDKDISKILLPTYKWSDRPKIKGLPLNEKRAMGPSRRAAAAPPEKRTNTTTQPDLPDLFISAIASHSARDLCESPMSRGPDFVSEVHGHYCDMDTKQLWPLCSTPEGASSRVCFNHDTQTFETKPAVRKRDGQLHEQDIPYKNFKKVERWS